MMDRQGKQDDFLERLMDTFRAEAEEHIDAFSTGFMQLEKSRDSRQHEQIIEALYREAHSLKGAARSVDLSAIESICQSLESVMRKFKHEGFVPRDGIFDVLYQAVNIIEKLNTPGNQDPPGDNEISDLIRQLDRVEQGAPVIKPGAETGAPGRPKEDHESKYIDRENRREMLKNIEARRQGKRREKQAAVHTASAVSTAPTAPASGVIRVSTEKLVRALLQAEELIYGKLSLNHLAEELDNIREELDAWRKKPQKIDLPGVKRLQAKLAELARFMDNDCHTFISLIDTHLEDMKKLLMLPFSTLTEGFPRAVRDLAGNKRKEVEIVIEGAENEIDKRVLEGLKDPLLHLLRNAVDHGVESPQERIQKNKPASGTIRLAISRQESSKVEILIADDGAGIDLEKVKEKIIAAGLITAEKLRELPADEILDFIFHSGFSTSPAITDISGRGLGLAIAREKVEKLGGFITVATQVNRGTTFRIVLPLTLATFRGVLVKTREARFIIPTLNVERVLRVRPADIKTVENRETIIVDDRVVSHIPLSGALELPQKPRIDKAPNFIQMLVLGAEGMRIAFSVDEVLGEEEVLIKNLGPQLRRVLAIPGAAILSPIDVVPILYIPELLKLAVKMSMGTRVREEKILKAKPRAVLLVEDSITSRVLLKNIMESAGYSVTAAVDGQAGWEALQREPFDIVVSDVDMPRMNGFQLTARIRADRYLSPIPVVLVTGLETKAEREKGLEVGANAYIVKSNFDPGRLLEVMKKLI
ncbi:MAG: response regulator [Candidatus Aminicenantes bacterium]|nr:response regulator [Candidatus Aminicenantes bacterium]